MVMREGGKIAFFAPKGRRTRRVVKRLNNGTALVNVQYLWPCFNCKSPMKVDYSTFGQLKQGLLFGLKCGECMPPPESGVMVGHRKGAA